MLEKIYSPLTKITYTLTFPHCLFGAVSLLMDLWSPIFSWKMKENIRCEHLFIGCSYYGKCEVEDGDPKD